MNKTNFKDAKCNCSIHCPQSPDHKYSCCHSQDCDCWCHKIINREHKLLIFQATAEQREGAERAYIQHRRVCLDVGINPESFGKFVAEWLEVESKPKETVEFVNDDDVYYKRNYELQFNGKRGWD